MTNGAERTRWKIRSDRTVDENPRIRRTIRGSFFAFIAHLDTRHVVVYRSTDNEIREIRWTTGGSVIFTG